MRVFDLSSPVSADAQQAIVAIGNFDAVHLGHQFLLAEAKKISEIKKLPLAVLTFEPHPRRLFRPDDAPFRITPINVKLERLEKNNVDIVYICPFNWELAELSSTDFISQILKNKINPADIIIGADFHFGHNRTGNADTLRAANLSVHAIDLKSDQHRGVISATRIRGNIQSGHMNEANELLGWEWEIRGTVIHGNKRGREIGYPTANVELHETIHPSYGIYATRVLIEGETEWRQAATNIGIRPMFEVKTGLVEAHLLDYTGDLYGKTIRIRPMQKIRDEMKFASLDELITQMAQDCQKIREILKS
jgi:riboflavin kinase/FMN adenylyltransferase